LVTCTIAARRRSHDETLLGRRDHAAPARVVGVLAEHLDAPGDVIAAHRLMPMQRRLALGEHRRLSLGSRGRKEIL
jgi:hypothetical protein